MWLYPNQSGFDHDLRGVKHLSDDKHGAAAGESDLKDDVHLLYRLINTSAEFNYSDSSLTLVTLASSEHTFSVNLLLCV